MGSNRRSPPDASSPRQQKANPGHSGPTPPFAQFSYLPHALAMVMAEIERRNCVLTETYNAKP